MCQYAMDDIKTDDPRWIAHEKWYCDRWGSFRGSNNIYAFYGLAKAMRRVDNPDGTIGDTTLGDDPTNPCSSPVDWYEDPTVGLARTLVNSQYSGGYWYSSSWVGYPMSTAWAIAILKPTLFCPAPVASCNADPEVSVVGCPVEFDGSDSTHPGAANPLPNCGSEIVSYEWDFQDGNTDTGEMVEHSFASNGVYNVTLTVTDDIGVEDFTTCQVSVEPPPVEPDSNPNGPYDHCIGGGTLLLDGSKSRDPDNSPCLPGNGIVSWAWELDTAEFPYDFDEMFGEIVDATDYFEAMGVGTYNIGLRVTDDEGESGDDFTVVNVWDDPIHCPCTPDPNSQGYWHRQCLGVSEAEGGIDPGRNGRGPQEPTEPNFVEELMPAIDAQLEDLGFYGLSTCEGMDADPASDPCEKALKQYTAMLLNIETDRLQDLCSLDLGEEGCASTNVGDLVLEIADLINGGYCKTAESCAAAVNEGYALTGGSETSEETDSGWTTVAGPRDDGPSSFGLKSGGTTTAGTVQEPASDGDHDRIDFSRLPGRRIQIPSVALRSGPPAGGFILYFNVPRGYKSDDPRVLIMSYEDDAERPSEEPDAERLDDTEESGDAGEVKRPRLIKRRPGRK
jgi:PKD repeat protein